MSSPTLRALRYVRSWLGRSAPLREQEVRLDREGTEVSATLLRPEQASSPLPAWIVLHGMTRPGRDHGQLRRFVRAVSSSGAVVLFPEVPEWMELKVAPGLTRTTTRASLDFLGSLPEVNSGPRGLVGFSFGCPQALLAASDPELQDELGSVVGFGGYCDLERALRFQLTGEHEWEGQRHELDPDPYAVWIVASNFLTAIHGYEDAGDVQRALHTLAAEAGDRQAEARGSFFDRLKGELRSGIAPERQALFDLFVPDASGGQEPSRAAVAAMITGLARAARDGDPILDPGQRLATAATPVWLVHGRMDRMIPYTETLRLAAQLPPGCLRDCRITDLFEHSADAHPPSLIEFAREGAAFFRTLRGILGSI